MRHKRSSSMNFGKQDITLIRERCTDRCSFGIVCHECGPAFALHIGWNRSWSL